MKGKSETMNPVPGKFIEVEVATLKPHPRNAKKHPPEQVALIVDSISQLGYRRPIVIDEDLTILSGHGRVEAFKQLKRDRVLAWQVFGLDEEDKRQYMAADNRLAELSQWNIERTFNELRALADKGIDIATLGFRDWDKWIADQRLDGLAETDQPAPSKIQVQIADGAKSQELILLIGSKLQEAGFQNGTYEIK